MAVLRHLDAEAARSLGDSPLAMLRALSGPALIHIPGRDSERARAVSVLLHGNEPSGLFALHRFLSERRVPAVDLLCSIGAVEAALAEPVFSRRMLDGRRDLNRCFMPPPDGPDGEIARELVTALSSAPLEFAVDLHNNTGDNPSYGVITSDTAATRGLVALFTGACVATELRLGTFMEALGEHCPTVTIECGRGDTPAAADVASRGLRAFAEMGHLDDSAGERLDMFYCSHRVQLRAGVTVDFGVAATGDADLTLRSDLERYNFEEVPSGELLGWVREGEVPLEVTDLAGRRHPGAEVFAVVGGELRSRRALLPAMMTTSPAAVACDCLCYLMEHERD